MTMVANERGQSIFEFLLMLPFLVGMSLILIKINTVIQMSIVDQQYARADALFLTFNSPTYPRQGQKDTLVDRKANQMILGVSDNLAPDDGEYDPLASTQIITRTGKVQGGDIPGDEPTFRSKVRVRNSVTLCTPTLLTTSENGPTNPILPPGGNVQLSEGSRFDFCSSKVPYL